MIDPERHLMKSARMNSSRRGFVGLCNFSGVLSLAIACVSCATATNPAGFEDKTDAAKPDAKVIDASDVDAREIDARPIDAREIDARPIDARPIDARPIDAAPDACVPVARQLLVNGDLESATNWRQVPNDPAFDIITVGSTGSPAFSGTHMAWFGGALSSVDELSQNFAVPATTTSFSVTAKIAIATEETTTLTQYDKMIVTVRTTAGTVLATLATLSNLDHNGAYATFTFPSATTFAGQTVRLVFRATTDSSNNTNFFVDDIAVNVLACP